MRNRIFSLIVAAFMLVILAGCNSAESSKSSDVEVLTGTGVYIGRADSNFIEIEVDGAPSETPFMVFMLNDEIKLRFETDEPAPGSTVSFEYTVNEYGQNLLHRLE